MADENKSWISGSLDALPGVLQGVSSIIYAEKGVNNTPVTYVQASGTGLAGTALPGGNNNMILYVIGGVAALVVLMLVLKK